MTKSQLQALSVSMFLLSTLWQYFAHAQPQQNSDLGLHDEDQWIVQDKKDQIKQLSQLKVFSDFQFTDKSAESGITFKHKAVTEMFRKNTNPAHYDHCCGMAIADVDGDGLLDIYFVSQLGGNELWQNLGNGKFKNITESAGVGFKGKVGSSASFADFNNDGLPDLYVTSINMGNTLYQNMGGGKFKDVTKEMGLELQAHSSGAIFFDYDHDGWLDLYVTDVGKFTVHKMAEDGFFLPNPLSFATYLSPNTSETNHLYHNDHGKGFTDVTEKMGLLDDLWSGDATVIDANGDGWPDLYVLSMHQNDVLYINQGGKKFVADHSYFPKTPRGAMGVKVFDYNNDGLYDLLLTDMHADMIAMLPPEMRHMKMDKAIAEAGDKLNERHPFDHYPHHENSIWGNAFFVNSKSGDKYAYTEKSDELGLENYWPWGVSVEDLNADGYEDVFITSSMSYPFRYWPNSLLLNDAGKHFYDAAGALNIEPRKDGQTRIYAFTRNCAWEYNPQDCGRKHRGPIKVNGTLGSRSSAIFDLDNDGDLDIVTNDFYAGPQVLISNLSDKREIHYLKIRLKGTTNNRSGIGSRIEVGLPDGKTLYRILDGKSGYLSQSDYPLYVGLGDNKSINKITVIWPNGKRQEVKDVKKINTLMTIEEI